ncbi:hypothetical protein NQ176_g4087 [Zarea fungicola]|uniref:Uncharacterized protein n=1 Tax=Zarea fungicola TaxID=93591 RepID=A0ACC1NF80_9HYPO|nr:hypothetical protein NQ176_g4087 [Lecanicillium fungicola]
MASKGSSASETGTLRPVACLNCRNRRSYCSKDKPSCSRCRDSGLLCVYEGARKVLVNEAYLRELERKAKAIDSEREHVVTGEQELTTETTENLGATATPIPIKYKGTTNTNEEEDEDFEDEEPLLESFNHLSLYQPSTSFQGPASSDTFLRNVSKVTGLGDEEGGLDIGPNFFEPGTLPSKKRTFNQHVRLPPLHIARRFFAAQYSFIGPIFAFTVSMEEFESALFEAYNGLPDATDREACLLSTP